MYNINVDFNLEKHAFTLLIFYDLLLIISNYKLIISLV
jgi:hypothetical protein